MKRGLASPWVHSALAITRRLRLQLSRVDQRKSLKRRAGLTVRAKPDLIGGGPAPPSGVGSHNSLTGRPGWPVRSKPDLIVAGPTPAVLAAKNATKTIPIVR